MALQVKQVKLYQDAAGDLYQVIVGVPIDPQSVVNADVVAVVDEQNRLRFARKFAVPFRNQVGENQ